MKGNVIILERLNQLLAGELAAINQYIVHSEMCTNWGYGKLAKQIKERAIGEMKHAEMLIERILFLEGALDIPGVSGMSTGDSVEKQLSTDHKAETEAVNIYNNSIRLCTEAGDTGTRQILESILRDEEKHLDWIETQEEQIRQLGLGSYLAEQTR